MALHVRIAGRRIAHAWTALPSWQRARIEKLTEYNRINAEIGGKLRRISERADSPSHSNYVTYIGPNREAFSLKFALFGRVKL